MIIMVQNHVTVELKGGRPRTGFAVEGKPSRTFQASGELQALRPPGVTREPIRGALGEVPGSRMLSPGLSASLPLRPFPCWVGRDGHCQGPWWNGGPLCHQSCTRWGCRSPDASRASPGPSVSGSRSQEQVGHTLGHRRVSVPPGHSAVTVGFAGCK